MEVLRLWTRRENAPASEHGGDRGDKRDLFFDRNLQGTFGLEARGKNAAGPAHNRREHGGAAAVRMREGKGTENLVVRREPKPLLRDDSGVAKERLLRDAGTFGLAGSAGGIENHAEVVRTDVDRAGLRSGASEILDSDQRDFTPRECHRLADQRLAFAIDDDQITAGMAQAEDQISRGGQDGGGYNGGPGIDGPEPGGWKIQLIRRYEEHSLSALETLFRKLEGAAAHHAAQFAVASRAACFGRPVDESELLGILLSSLVDTCGEGVHGILWRLPNDRAPMRV